MRALGLELSGMVGFQGTLARPLPLAGGAVPGYIELLQHETGPALEWATVDPQGGPSKLHGRRPYYLVDNVGGALDAFVRLAEASPDAVLRFARRWGVLLLCEDGWPPSSDPHYRRDLRPTRIELVSTWQQHAGLMRAILSLASDLHQDKPGEGSAWERVFATLYSGDTESWWWWNEEAQRDVSHQKFLLGGIIDNLLRWVGVRPTFQWWSIEPEIRLSGGGLYQQLVCQLVFAVARVNGIAVCHSCGGLYPPKRKPQVGRMNYCPDCGQRAAKRDYASRRRWQKK